MEEGCGKLLPNLFVLETAYTRARGSTTHKIQFMWLDEKSKMVQVHITLDLKLSRDQRNLDGWKVYMVTYNTSSG